MIHQERQHKILEMLEAKSRVWVAELSAYLGVSEATVRRDLDRMKELGQVTRVHGGAILAEKATPEPPVMQRTVDQMEEKRRIGRAAAELIQDGETVFLGSGTTTLEVARNLLGRKNLTVITNALTVINALAQNTDISLVATGGLLRPSELSFIGYLTEQALRELRPQKVVMGIRAISLKEGLTNDYLPEVTTDRVIINSAPEVILVADHTKFGKVSTAFVASFQNLHKIVTDTGTPPEIVAELQRSEIAVLIV